MSAGRSDHAAGDDEQALSESNGVPATDAEVKRANQARKRRLLVAGVIAVFVVVAIVVAVTVTQVVGKDDEPAVAKNGIPPVSPIAQGTSLPAIDLQLQGLSELMDDTTAQQFEEDCTAFFSAQLQNNAECTVLSQQLISPQRLLQEAIRSTFVLEVTVEVSIKNTETMTDVLVSIVDESGSVLMEILVETTFFVPLINIVAAPSPFSNIMTSSPRPSLSPLLSPTLVPSLQRSPMGMEAPRTAAPSIKSDVTIPVTPTVAPTVASGSIREIIETAVGTENLREVSYSRALEWILFEDPLQLDESAPNLLQRFLAAYIYYATSVKREWASCAPPVAGEDEFCMYKELVVLEPPSYAEIPWRRWLSNTTECQWAGMYCDELGQFSALEFSGMNMTGTFPEGVKYFPFAQSLKLAFGELEGTLPESVADMKHLINLELQGNRFTGTVPEVWYRSRSLQRINLGMNDLNGSISSEIGLLKDMKGMFLFGNRVSGQIPDAIGELSSMDYLRLNRNQVTGTIPATIGNLPKLRDLWLHDNAITGTIPWTIGLMASVTDIRFGANALIGTLPESLYSLTNLFRLDVSNNNLFGTISSAIGQLEYLDMLLLQFNAFSGRVPSSIGVPFLRYLSLQGNDFTSVVPNEVCGVNELVADCAASRDSVPEIACPCCDFCCDADGLNCLPV